MGISLPETEEIQYCKIQKNTRDVLMLHFHFLKKLILNLIVPKYECIFFKVATKNTQKNLENQHLVVMITSHDEFALESYEYNVTDFLKKPVEWARFIKTVKKIICP